MLVGWFVLGLAAGSFLNLLIARLPARKPVFSWPVSCPACGTTSPPSRISAVLSYALNRQYCRECGSRIDNRDLLVELATGALFAALYLRFGMSLPLVVYSLYICVLVVAFMIDLEHRLIPNAVTFPGIAFGLPLGLIIPGLGSWSGLLGGLFYGGIFLLFFLVALALYRHATAFGLGDVKLALLIGLITGLKGAMIAALLGTLIGGLLALGLLASRRVSTKSAMPYGPSLVLGALVTILWSPWIG